MTRTWIKPLFMVAAAFEVLAALAFLFFANAIFQWSGVTPPNHPGYVTFPALLLLVFGAMYFRVAGDPVKYRELMVYGMGLKVAFFGNVFFFRLTSGIPDMWLPLAWADLAFFVLFYLAWRATAAPMAKVA